MFCETAEVDGDLFSNMKKKKKKNEIEFPDCLFPPSMHHWACAATSGGMHALA